MKKKTKPKDKFILEELYKTVFDCLDILNIKFEFTKATTNNDRALLFNHTLLKYISKLIGSIDVYSSLSSNHILLVERSIFEAINKGICSTKDVQLLKVLMIEDLKKYIDMMEYLLGGKSEVYRDISSQKRKAMITEVKSTKDILMDKFFNGVGGYKEPSQKDYYKRVARIISPIPWIFYNEIHCFDSFYVHANTLLVDNPRMNESWSLTRKKNILIAVMIYIYYLSKHYKWEFNKKEFKELEKYI